MDVINAELADLGIELQAQIGINSGSAIAGIIGHKRFQYDLCGDAVNTAARMASYSAPGCINVSQATCARARPPRRRRRRAPRARARDAGPS